MMPELPDVEGYRRFFERHAAGKEIRSISVCRDMLRNATPQALGRALRGRRFAEPVPHGKWLMCPTGGPILVLHFGMTGDLIWSGDEPDRHRHDRLFIELSGGELRYRNMRKLGCGSPTTTARPTTSSARSGRTPSPYPTRFPAIPERQEGFRQGE